MTMDWGGAQWVLTCWFAFRLVMPLLFRAAGAQFNGKSPKPLAEWAGWYLSVVFDVAALVGVLLWGGFF